MNDYLNSSDLKDLRYSYKYFKTKGWNALPGANTRAMFKFKYNARYVILKSYYTNVLMIDLQERKLYKLWDGYSVTTLKHVNLLCKMFDMKQFSKKEWETLKVDKSCFI